MRTEVIRFMDACTEVRKPTREEKQELRSFLIEVGHDEAEAVAWVENNSIAVFPHYRTDTPQYVGKVMLVVWSGCYSYYQLFIWVGGKMKYISQGYEDYKD